MVLINLAGSCKSEVLISISSLRQEGITIIESATLTWPSMYGRFYHAGELIILSLNTSQALNSLQTATAQTADSELLFAPCGLILGVRFLIPVKILGLTLQQCEL